MEILIIFILTLLNGFFSLSEIALVSLKKSRIEHLASQGSVRAKIVLKLLENPANFLSSVQVGITLIGIISGAYGGATLTDDMEHFLISIGFQNSYTHTISLISVIGGITYFSIVIGELVPKSIAMNNSERIALVCVPIIKYFTIATYPFVKLLSISTSFFLKIFGVKVSENDKVSEEELLFLLKNAGKQGVLETEESQVHQNLFYFTDQTAKSLMTHSSEVEWINIYDSVFDIYDKLKDSAHSKFIVGEGSMDKIKGVLNVKDFLGAYKHANFKLEDIIYPPIFVVQSTNAFKILNLFKKNKQYISIVVDEYGDTIGIVTLHDLIEAIVGDLPDEDETDEENIIKRADGSFLLDGKTLIFEVNQYFQQEIIEDNISEYTTISGFFIDKLEDFPATGNIIKHDNYQFEIMDMDGIRIDKILMTRLEEAD